MNEDRRKFLRFDIPLDVKFKSSIAAGSHSKGTTVNISRSGLCFEAKKLDYKLNDLMELKVKMPKNDDYISVTGDLAWKEEINDSRCLVGITFREIDIEAKNHILDHAYNAWLLNLRR
ncbi:MAG TPA: PilZ domain-containing protein [Nitrospirae bacterium]|nr:PilZ domain protein [bacterium BMS3Abin09]HDH34092.1 PilZ domain-containing protein [Nitrospirota bacterium]HDN95425.1 PilZ domain-containing protein [Nitrospirota bacterium]HDZ84789.1 PilZ domain-containing protein [Nitrospirota bacterium]